MSAPASGRPADSSCGSPGLSGAGKSTLAYALRDRLAPIRRVEILDGDEVRLHLSKGLGFSREDRDTNVRRIGFVARLLARNGTATVTAAISPYADVRREVRELAERDGVAFVEVHADASLDALAARDVKGLYRKAMAGEIPHFTGVSDPYEPPDQSRGRGAERSRVDRRKPVAHSGLFGIARAGEWAGHEECGVSGDLFPVFLKLAGRPVLVVGAGPVAESKLQALLAAGARVTVVAPEVRPSIERQPVTIVRRGFDPQRFGRRVVRRGGGAAGSESGRRRCSRVARDLRQRRGRSGECVGISRRRRAPRWRDAVDLDGRPRARAGRTCFVKG